MEAKATRSCIGIIIHSPFVDKIIIGSCFILSLVVMRTRVFSFFCKVRNTNKTRIYYMLQNSLQFQQFSKNVSPIYANNPPKDSQLFDVKSRNIGKEKP
jgi:hypothetical protein